MIEKVRRSRLADQDRTPGYRYKLYYKVLDPKSIINLLIPPDRKQFYVDTLNKRNGFYEKLERSFLKDGILNPILVCAGNVMKARRGWMPKGWEYDKQNLLVCDLCGGSRLHVAQKLDMPIPAIISDFVQRFANDPDAISIPMQIEEVKKFFHTPPEKIVLKPEGLFFTKLPHFHLQDKNVNPDLKKP